MCRLSRCHTSPAEPRKFKDVARLCECCTRLFLQCDDDWRNVWWKLIAGLQTMRIFFIRIYAKCAGFEVLPMTKLHKVSNEKKSILKFLLNAYEQQENERIKQEYLICNKFKNKTEKCLYRYKIEICHNKSAKLRNSFL